MACAGLHNLCKERNLDIPVQQDVEDADEANNVEPHLPVEAQRGLMYRDHFVNLHFG